MVEIHLVGREAATTVGARHPPPFAEHLGCAVLAHTYAKDLLLAVPPVVVDVRWALVTTSRHAYILEHVCGMKQRVVNG